MMKTIYNHGSLMKMRCIAILMFTFSHFLNLSFSSAIAQTFTERIQQKTTDREGRLTIRHSAAIDKLVNAGSKAIVTTPSSAAKTLEKKDTTRQEKNKNIASKAAATPPPATDDSVDDSEGQTTVDTRKKVMRNSYRITGYRVQAYAGGNQRKDRQKAEQVGNDIKMNYPEEPIYVHFYSPRWICRVGNYRTYEEAHQMLVNIRKLGYTSATIVKGKISIQY